MLLGGGGYLGSNFINNYKKNHEIILHSRKNIKEFSTLKQINGDIKNKTVILICTGF